MNAVELIRIRNNPTFKELESKRSRFAWTLAGLMFAIYMGFMFLVAFGHSFVAQVIGAGPYTLAFPLGLGVMIAAVVLTGIYVFRANSEFDRLTREIIGQQPAAAAPYGVRLAEGVR